MNRCLFVDIHETHKCTVGKECRIFLMLNLAVHKASADVDGLLPLKEHTWKRWQEITRGETWLLEIIPLA